MMDTRKINDLYIIMKSDIRKKLDDVDFESKIKHDVCISKLPDSLKVLILKYLNGDTERTKAKHIAEIAYKFFEAEDVINSMHNIDDIEKWKDDMVSQLSPNIQSFSDDEIAILLPPIVTLGMELFKWISYEFAKLLLLMDFYKQNPFKLIEQVFT